MASAYQKVAQAFHLWQDGDPMALKVKISGTEVVFQTEDDLARTLVAIERIGESGAVPSQGRKYGFDALFAALRFLSVIKEAGTNGAQADTIGPTLQVSALRGIGVRAALVTDELAKLKFKRDDVYTTQKTAKGRLWKPGPKIDDAIEAVRRKLEASAKAALET